MKPVQVVLCILTSQDLAQSSISISSFQYMYAALTTLKENTLLGICEPQPSQLKMRSFVRSFIHSCPTVRQTLL